MQTSNVIAVWQMITRSTDGVAMRLCRLPRSIRLLRHFPALAFALFFWGCIFVMNSAFGQQAALTKSIASSQSSQSSQSSLQSQPVQALLTETEKDFVRNAKPIRVGVSGIAPPLYQLSNDGKLDGIVGDYLRWISERTGLNFEVTVASSVQELLQRTADGHVDLLPMFPSEKTRPPGFKLSPTYLNIPIVYIARHGLTDVSPTNSFGGHTVAVVSGAAVEENLRRTMPDAKLAGYMDIQAALNAVSAGDADVFVGPLSLASYHIDKNLLINLDLRGELNINSAAYAMAVSDKLPELVSIIQKTLKAITVADDISIRNKWSPNQSILKPLDMQAALTPEERQWVKQNREVRVAYDREFVPFSFEVPGGAMSGLAADYLALVELKVGLKVASTQPDTWDGALAAVRSGRANLLIASARNDERREYLNFIGPYAGVPTAIITRLDDRAIVSMDDLAGEKIAAIQSHFLLPALKRRYPGIQIMEVESQRAALDAVDSGQVRAAIGNLNVVDPILQRHFLGVLRVVNTVARGDSELYFAVPRNDVALARIMRKGLDGISPAEHATLRQKWLSVTYQSGVPWRQIMQIGLPILLALMAIILVTLWWNRKLKLEIALRRAAELKANNAASIARSMSEAKSRFLATMSHEIRGPVSGIVGTADALMRHAESPREKERLQVIRDSGEYLIRLLTQVLDYTKAETGKFTPLNEPTNLQRLLQEAANPFRYVAKQKNLTIKIVAEGPLANAHLVDALRLRQVITNLTSNALKFTEQGGVTLTLIAVPPVSKRLADKESETQAVQIRVQDTGPGIPTSERGQLFNPYAQTDLGRARPDSTGLGLTICKEVIERLGGTIELADYDGENNGACFVITMTLPVMTLPVMTLPAMTLPTSTDVERDTIADNANDTSLFNQTDTTEKNAAQSTTAQSTTAQSTIAQRKTIQNDHQLPRVLLADDDPLNLALHREVLEGEGFMVDTATNGQEALACWQQHRHTLIFSDGSMPTMSGLEFVKQLRMIDVNVNANASGGMVKPWIVLLTSYSSELDRDEFMQSGVNDFIEKPLLPRNLQEVLARRAAAHSSLQ